MKNIFDTECNYWINRCNRKEFEKLSQFAQLELCKAYYKEYPDSERIFKDYLSRPRVDLSAYFARDAAELIDALDQALLDSLFFIVATEYNCSLNFRRSA